MYKKFDLFFGFFVIGIFLWFLWFLTSSFFTDGKLKTYNLKALFSSIDGISVGSDVKISGIKVGEVTHVSVNPKSFQAEVEIKILTKFKLPTDSSVSVQSSGLLGSKYLELAPGVEDDNLKDRDTIKYTQSALNLEKLISQFATKGGKP